MFYPNLQRTNHSKILNKSQTLFSAIFRLPDLYQAKQQFKLSYILSPQSSDKGQVAENLLKRV
jgi:hypothetical protein